MDFRLDWRDNTRLRRLCEFLEGNSFVNALWKQSNIVAVGRLKYTDHGPVHAKIVAKRSLEIIRLLYKGGIKPTMMTAHGMSFHDSELVVVAASALHDIGHVVHRHGHELHAIPFAVKILDEILPSIYSREDYPIVLSEILHAIYCHDATIPPLTIEAGVVSIADALDMEQGRARIPFSIGKVDIHSVSALSVEKVIVAEGEERPVMIIVKMSDPSGIFQLDQLLRRRIESSGLKDHVYVRGEIKSAGEPPLKMFEMKL